MRWAQAPVTTSDMLPAQRASRPVRERDGGKEKDVRGNARITFPAQESGLREQEEQGC